MIEISVQNCNVNFLKKQQFQNHQPDKFPHPFTMITKSYLHSHILELRNIYTIFRALSVYLIGCGLVP